MFRCVDRFMRFNRQVAILTSDSSPENLGNPLIPKPAGNRNFHRSLSAAGLVNDRGSQESA
jgi:hypothetical protein